jgi:hypothetical protein
MAEPLLRGVGVERVIFSTELDPFLSLRALAATAGCGNTGMSARRMWTG